MSGFFSSNLRLAVAGLAVVSGVVSCHRLTVQPEVLTASASEKKQQYPVVIRRPEGSPAIPTGAMDECGRPVTVACATCHSTMRPNDAARVGTPLVLFHQGLKGQHGGLTCASCHNPADGYASLRRADGSTIEFADTMQLCAQCHGLQFRDYQRGAHGGMTGYWDLNRGGRSRNTCTDCHDPHVPKYPTLMPAPGPNDRFPPAKEHE